MAHPFQPDTEGSIQCGICGCLELEDNHLWRCEEHTTVGNGAFNCFYCRDKI